MDLKWKRYRQSCTTGSRDVRVHSGLKPVIYMFRMVFSIIGVVFRVKVLKIDAGAGNEDVFLEEQK